VHRQHEVELRPSRPMHPADIAYILESLPSTTARGLEPGQVGRDGESSSRFRAGSRLLIAT